MGPGLGETVGRALSTFCAALAIFDVTVSEMITCETSMKTAKIPTR